MLGRAGEDGFLQEELGPVDGITPLGQLFYRAKTQAMQEECFLRGLMVPMEPISNNLSFSPLLWVLQVMLKLFEMVHDYQIGFIEFATCVQTTNPLNNITDVCNRIIQVRADRELAEDKEEFDKNLIHNEWLHYCKDEDNFRQYADMNIRYLKATGVIRESTLGITLVPDMLPLVYRISNEAVSSLSLKERYLQLCNGAPLFK